MNNRGSKSQPEVAANAMKKLKKQASKVYGYGDHLLLLFIFEEWIEEGRSFDWCKANCVNYSTLRNSEMV